MTDKLEALSQPVAYTDREELESMQGPDGDTYAALWTIPHGFGQDMALYSHEYVTTLLDAVKLEKEQSAYYEKQMWHFHGLAESESERARIFESASLKHLKRIEDTEQREDRYRQRWVDAVADLDPANKRIAELEQRLQQPIKPPKFDGSEDVAECVFKFCSAIRAAGFKVQGG